MSTTDLLVIVVVGIALIFDFVNGFHDAANSIATIVATRVLKPWQAVIWAAFFNFISFLVLPLAVANTIAKIVDPDVVSIGLVFAGLVGAIFWNVLTAWLGLPSSSSHALIGGMVGAGVAKAGWDVVNMESLRKTAAFIVYSPLIGLVLGFSLIIIVSWSVYRFKNRNRVNKSFRGMQLLSAAAFSIGHGANDAQKTMGIIVALLIGADKLDSSVLDNSEAIPLWIVLSCHAAIALGTMTGGWKIADGRRVRRERRRSHVVLRLVQRHPGQHHAHHHRCHRRCRVGEPPVRRALGGGPSCGVGVGAHHSGFGAGGRAHLLDRAGALVIDKRAVFFFVSALVSVAMMPLLPDDPKHVWLQRTPIVLVVALVILGILSWLDHWSRHRTHD
jgi:inorganic phosphate transporter, PiT family